MVPITELRSLPQISGIYKVLDASENVVYVGQAENTHDLWNKSHHKLGKIIAECGVAAYFGWVEVPEWLLNRTENAVVSFSPSSTQEPLLWSRPDANSKTAELIGFECCRRVTL